ncbi:MAG TPA: DUF4184 family protein [Chryseosolibacter sp.]|nr:DUF4184 family protein [Chryseosolibacter sp.]
MPFTPAHAAIVLPFLRVNPRRLSATGLVVGSLAPDFEYFLKMTVNSTHSHTVAGLFYFDLPVTLLLSILFHRIAKINLIHALPTFVAARFFDTLSLNFLEVLKKYPLAFCLSAILGSFSHVLWDSFTHGDGFFVTLLGYKYGYYIPFDGVRYPLWYAFQHISTVAGLALIVAYIFFKRRLPGFSNASINRLAYWATVVTIMVVVAGLRFLLKPYDFEIGNVVVSGIAGFLVGIVAAGRLNFETRR